MEQALAGRTKKASRLDVLAGIFCAALFAYLFYSINRGIGVVDESFYYTIVQRMIRGDRFFLDDWHVSQLSSVLQFLPYKLFTVITGGTDGVLLFMRYVYVFCSFCVYWFLYGKLRKYGLWGLASVVFFSAFIFVFKTMCYMTMSIHGTAVFCGLLFTDSKRKPIPLLLLAGIVFACTVLAEPMLVFAYAAYCIVVLIYRVCGKRRSDGSRYAFALNGRNWFFVSLGILFCFSLFMVVIQIRCGIMNIVRIVPELFSDSEYDVLHENMLLSAFRREYKYAIELNGKWTIVGLYIMLFLTCVYHFCAKYLLCAGKDGKTSDELRAQRRLLIAARCRLALLCTACFFFICACIHEFVWFFSDVSSAIELVAVFPLSPTLLFGLCCVNLCRKKDPCLLCIMLAAVVYSVPVDCASDMVALPGSSVALLGSVPQFGILWREIRDDELLLFKRGSGKKLRAVISARAVMALCAVLLCGWMIVYLVNVIGIGVVEKLDYYDDPNAPLNVVLDSGVYKGVHTTEKVRKNYADIMTDMDSIKQRCSGTFYVADLAAMPYLYADLPYGTYSAWYVDGDWQTRLIRYWQIYPSRLPEYIYFPYYWFECQESEDSALQRHAEQLAFLDDFCSYEKESGQAGDIVHVLFWDTEKVNAQSTVEIHK